MKTYQTLISAEVLARRLDDPGLRIVDCRYSLTEPDSGREAYRSGHIPGAVYAHLDEDLAAPVRADSGRHPLPEVDSLLSTLRRFGVSNDDQVVAYDAAGGALAARLWWMLRWLGHRNVAVLDGGFGHWEAAGLPVSQRGGRIHAGTFDGSPDVDLVISAEEVARRLDHDEGFVLVDARDEARFRGETEPLDAVAGHVPGAINLPFAANIGEDGRWRPRAEVRARWPDLAGFRVPRGWAVMCGSGVTACHLALAAEYSGIPEPRLYVGSWSEWIRDPTRAVALG